MKKQLLALSLFLAGAVTAFAELVTFNIEIADASTVTAEETYYDSTTYTSIITPIALSDGVNTLTIDNDNHTVNIKAKDGYFITSCIQQSNGNSLYISDKTQTSISVNPYNSIAGDTFVIVTKTYAESRTASVTVNIDEPAKINMMRYQISGYEFFTEPSTVISYDPESELPLMFNTRNYSDKIYRITVSEGTVEESYGTWRVTPVDGATIDVQVNFPDIDITYTLESNIGSLDFLTVRAGNPLQPVDISSGTYSVKAGSSVEYTYDTQNYRINSLKINGVENPSATWSYSFTASYDATHSFDVHKYGEFNARVHIDNPGKVRVLKGSTYGTETEGIDGVYTVAMKEPYDNQLSVVSTDGWYIKEATVEPEDANFYWQKTSFTYSAPGECDIYVKVAEIVKDKKLALYIDNADLLSYFSGVGAMGSTIFHEYSTGYNVYDVSAADSPVNINGYSNELAASVSRVYYNHTLIGKDSEWSTTYAVPYVGNDVIHVYVANDPAEATLAFDIEEGIEVEAVHNKVVNVASLDEPLTLFKGDEVSVKVNLPADGYILTVNDAVSAPDETGNHTFALADDATTVKVVRATALGTVEADNAADAPVYNLQGIRVDRSRLTPGIYIQAGRKFRVK